MNLAHPTQVVKRPAMSFWQRLVYLVLFGAWLATITRYSLWWFQASHIPHNGFLDVPLFLMLSFVVFIGPVQQFGPWFSLWFMANPKPLKSQKGLRVAFLTCFVPGKEPLAMLDNTLRAMVATRYPHDTWVLDEGNSPAVMELCKRLGVFHFSRANKPLYNTQNGSFRTKTKAGNHNAWRAAHEDSYDIVAQIDMDHVPQPHFFERTLGFFRDPSVGFVGMPQVYKNTDNWIARGAAEQAYFFHGPIQKGYYGCDMPFLIGTSHIYRVSAMKEIGGYAPTIVEDHLTGMRFFAHGWRGVFVPEILAEGEGPTNWVDYFNQQMRWSYGLFEILFRHTPGLLRSLNWKQRINYTLAQLYYFSGVAVVLGTILTVLYLGFGIRSANMNLVTWFLYVTPVFILSQLGRWYVHRFSIRPKLEPVYGLLGMFLNLGANVIYAIALVKFAIGKKLRYMVTQKGETAQNQTTTLWTFRYHLVIALAALGALLMSFPLGNGAIQLRGWALFTTMTLLGVSISSTVNLTLEGFRHLLVESRALRVTYRFALASAVVIVFTVLYAQRSSIAAAVTRSGRYFPLIIERPIAGKIAPPPNGAFLGISQYVHNDIDAIDRVEDSLDRPLAIIGYYQSWGSRDNGFSFTWADNISETGAVPMITWEPWEPIAGFTRNDGGVNQPNYRLSTIADGAFDEYIRDYATSIREYGKPVMIRFAHEMNGNWYPWGSTLNTPEDYIAAWRHIHEIFTSAGATNVTWVWSPNELYRQHSVPNANRIEAFYPGDDYVDWVGLSAFNWAGMYKANTWREPTQLLTQTIEQLEKFHKPVIISEIASADTPGRPTKKAGWIKDLSAFAKNHPEVKAIVWFNAVDSGIDWTIGSTPEALSSFVDTFDQSYWGYQAAEVI